MTQQLMMSFGISIFTSFVILVFDDQLGLELLIEMLEAYG